MEQFILHYDGSSFEWHKISLHDLTRSLRGVEWLVKIIDPSVTLTVTPFENGGFKVNLSNVADNTIGWLIAAAVISAITFFSHTASEPYTVDLSNSTMNGDVNIVNISGVWHTFHQSILPIVREDKTRKCLQQICESVRWWIYEINYKQKTFRVEIHEGYSFSVSLAEGLELSDIASYVDTDALEITGNVKMSRDGKILSMKMFSYREAQSRMNFSED